MKHLILFIFLMLGLSIKATVETPDFYSEDFTAIANQGGTFPAGGWTTTGIDAEPSEAVAQYFGKGQEAYRVFTLSNMNIAMANTEFADGSEADEWLISPEIEVPYENASLLFTACAYTNYGEGLGVGMNKFRVLLSSGGKEKSDFSETLLETGIRGSATVEVTTKRLVVPVNGMKGKKVRFAFVATGNNVGLTGFTDLRMGQYILDVTNLTPEVASLGSHVAVDVNIGLKTPVECGYVDAQLSIDGKDVGSKEFKKSFGLSSSYIMLMQRIQFEDAIELADDTPVSYTLTLTPRFEGAIPSVVSGYVATPGATYPANVVVEEMTATGCGYCPRGSAALEYYLHKYPGGEDKGRAICIGIHGFMEYFDPMSEGVENYLEAAQTLNGYNGYPAAMFNRSTRGLDPAYYQEVEKQIGLRSYNYAKIKSAALNGDNMELTFEIRNGYNTASRPLNASVVLIENNVKGNDSGYNQRNYYASYTATTLESMYGSELIPYLQPYSADGDFGTSIIPFGKIEYQHVARGIFPDFNGVATTEEWKSDIPKEFKISFSVPSTVMKIDNTQAVLLVTDPSSGIIVASDIISAPDYNTTAMTLVKASSCRATAAEGGISIITGSAAKIRVIALSGRTVLNADVASGETYLPCPGNGLYIVEVIKEDGNKEVMKVVL